MILAEAVALACAACFETVAGVMAVLTVLPLGDCRLCELTNKKMPEPNTTNSTSTSTTIVFTDPLWGISWYDCGSNLGSVLGEGCGVGGVAGNKPVR